MGPVAAAHANQTGQTGQPDRLVPLAYVRRLAVAPVALATRPDPALPPFVEPPGLTGAAARKARARFASMRAARAELLKLRGGMVASVRDALPSGTTGLARVPGLDTVPLAASAPPLWAGEQAGDPAATGTPDVPLDAAGRPQPLPDAMRAAARAHYCDGTLALAVDRFGVDRGLEREVWVRVVAWLAADGETGQPRGPYLAYGVGSTDRNLLGKGYRKDDATILRAAAEQCVRRLTHTLETGEELPFVRSARVAIVPAAVPSAVEKEIAPKDSASDVTAAAPETARIPVPALVRQSDVLLQPEVGPVVTLVRASDARDAAERYGFSAADLWQQEGGPDTAKLRLIAERLRARYVFVSRITSVSLSDEAIEVSDAGAPRVGIERRAEVEAEAALVDGRDGQMLWRDSGTGGTVARTEYVRHQPRLRTDEQCVLDAAVASYARLRFAFADYLRRFER